MSIYAGPETNDTNINFCVDASNPKSYSGSGTSWIDLTQGRVATLTNGPTYSSDNGGSFTFDGINDFATFSTVQVTTNLTITAWIKTTSTDSTSSAIYAPALPIVGETASSVWYSLGVTAGKLRYINARKDGIWTTYDSTASVNNGIWRRIAVTHSSTSEQVKLYVDGVLDSTFSNAAAGGGAYSNYFALYMTASKIGTSYGSADFFDGSIASVKILNLLYSDADVAQDFASNRGRFRPTLPTGGNISVIGSYRIHTFTSSSTFATNDFGGLVDYMIVAGGGGGGGFTGGGGGAGGHIYTPSRTLAVNTSYTVTVGGGGAGGGPGNVNGSNGTSSSFNSQTATAGGYGATNSVNGNTGGSGGGAGWGASGGSGTSGQGNNGGNGAGGAPNYGGGGGGGAGNVGANGTTTTGGTGGSGVSNDISGVLTSYAGGGGGGTFQGGTAGTGGTGGGGNAPFGNGTANTGGGGGGSSDNSNTTAGGNGGSGVVIIRYKYPF